MKKCSFILFVIVSLQGMGQNNPFAEFGYEPKFLTLSKGQFEEFFDQDTVVQIGNALFNTRQNKLVGFVEDDTLHPEYTSPEIMSRWLSPDPLAAKYPSHSPYNFVNSNPIILIDPDGREWVNVHTARVQNLQIRVENSRGISKFFNNIKLNSEIKAEARINTYLNNLKTNDRALYNYVDNLTITNREGNTVNVQARVGSYYNSSSSEEAKTTYSFNRGDGKPEPGLYNGVGIATPFTSKGSGVVGFNIGIKGQGSFGDVYLANEAGDIMYVMEYNEDAIKEGGNAGMKNASGGMSDAYYDTGSGNYSIRVEETYKQRKADGSGKDSKNNPYPLQK